MPENHDRHAYSVENPDLHEWNAGNRALHVHELSVVRRHAEWHENQECKDLPRRAQTAVVNEAACVRVTMVTAATDGRP